MYGSHPTVLFRAWKVLALSGLDPQHPMELEQDHTPTTAGVWSYRFKVITIHNMMATQKSMSLSCVKTHPMRTWISRQCKTRCAATQAWSAQPPNTTVNEILYHTPAAAGVVILGILSMHETPQREHHQEQSPQVPATYAMGGKARYHTPTKVGVWYSKTPSLYENPPDRNTMKPRTKYGCAQPHQTLIPKQPYHMPAAAGVWYYQGASLHSNPSNENTDDTLREYRRGPTRNTDVHSHLGKCYKIKPWNACEMKAPAVYACKVLVSCKNF
ncbi:hypothetical protein BS47DRAFT_1357642 [Hydnum rufescens UP504]|uniref:Uncharacterized protein n=1 Tax=Hydnum rufescens UP504 TaxID=1448309 RepID=A0A9P6B9W8_9AGAM|nr:hypothetical protein BS47DRAFT_1357642 [Hydnum rufescens UP504]